MRLKLRAFKGDAGCRACMLTALEARSKLDVLEEKEEAFVASVTTSTSLFLHAIFFAVGIAMIIMDRTRPKP